MLLFFKKLIAVCALLFCCCLNAFAQTETDTSSLLSAEYNPRIIVIPFTKTEFGKVKEDIRVVLNNDINRRIAVAKFKEAFDNRDVSTIDFFASMAIADEINKRNELKRADFEQFFIENSGADVYVVVDVDTQRRIITEGGEVALKVRLIVTAYQVATGISLSNNVCESPEFFTNDAGKLVSKAVESCAADFIATIERKWKNDIIKNGRPVMIDIGFTHKSPFTMKSLAGTNTNYEDAIEQIVGSIAKGGKYSIQSASVKKLFFNSVRIPLTDPNGKEIHVTQFGTKLISEMAIAKIIAQKEVRDNSIYILIE